MTDELISRWTLGRVHPTPAREPNGWELVQLSSVAKLESGHTPSRRYPAYWDGDVPWISLHDSTALDVPEITGTAQTIGVLGLANSSARLLPKGTVVFSRTATVGKATVMGREMATSQDFANYVCGERVHNHYLVHLFRFMAPEWKRLMAGSTLNTIYMPVFRDLQILLPPVEEQRAIAAALSDVDALIGSLDRLIVKKRDLKQAAMQQLLTGATRLPGFGGKTVFRQSEVGRIPEDWAVSSLGKCVSCPPRYGINAAAVPLSDRLPTYIRITDITTDGRFAPDEKVSVDAKGAEAYFLKKGDLVFARTGASVGKSYLYRESDGPLVFAGFLIRVVADERHLSPEYLAAYVTTGTYWAWVRAMSMRSGQPGINGNEYAQLPLPLPSIEEQAAIASVLSDMDTELAALEQRRDKTKLLKQGMMQELLTGRVRLVSEYDRRNL